MNFQPSLRTTSVPGAQLSTTLFKVTAAPAPARMTDGPPSASQLQMTTGKTVASQAHRNSSGFFNSLCCCRSARHTRERLPTPSTQQLAVPEPLALRDLTTPEINVTKAIWSSRQQPPASSQQRLMLPHDETGVNSDAMLPGSPTSSIRTAAWDHKQTLSDPEAFTFSGTIRRLSCTFEEPLLDLFKRCYPDGQISSTIFDNLNPNTLDHLAALLEIPSMKKFIYQYPIDFAQRFNGLTIMGLRGRIMCDAIDLGVLTIDHLRVIDRRETRGLYNRIYPNHPLNINLIKRLINTELLTQQKIRRVKEDENLKKAEKVAWIKQLNADKVTMDAILRWNLTSLLGLNKLQDLCE